MAPKIGIIEQLGESGLFLPELINRGLMARDKLKYYVSLLQAAHVYAQSPHHPAPTLRGEREASGIADAALDLIVPASRSIGDNIVSIPGAHLILEQIFGNLRQMLQPLRAAVAARPEMRERFEIYQARLDQQIAGAPPCHDDQMTAAAIEALARRTENGHDSVNQLAMDLQWELNRLNGSVSLESVDGATTYSLTTADRALVHAFMTGVNETSRLKFDRPGLGTTATRDSNQLTIQNDLGSSDVHVIVVHVRELTATVIYTDIHRARIRFLHDLLRPHDIHWETPSVAAGATYEMSVGSYTATSQAALEAFLTFLGSRLVFLLEWNRARKRLARFVKNSEAVALLRWAADNNVGHHAFLQAGDVRLITTALERATPSQVRFGARLDELLGPDAARLFLMSVLGIVSAGMSGGRSMRLIEDEIEAELLTHLRTTDRSVLGAAAEHASVMATIADHLAHALTRLKHGDGRPDLGRVSELAKNCEERADEIVRRSSRLLDQTNDGHRLRRLLSQADDVADALEKTSFMLTVVPPTIDQKSLAMLEELAELVNRGAREYVRCLEDARDLSHTANRVEIERFLVTVDQLAELRHQVAGAERIVRERLIRSAPDFRELHVASAIAQGFDEAAHTLARCGLIVRDYVLNATTGRAQIP
jgi:uncharacterized protein Yka (UPF0111/DUF47 family)